MTTTLLTGRKDGWPFTFRASKAIVTGCEDCLSRTIRAKLNFEEGSIEIVVDGEKWA